MPLQGFAELGTLLGSGLAVRCPHVIRPCATALAAAAMSAVRVGAVQPCPSAAEPVARMPTFQTLTIPWDTAYRISSAVVRRPRFLRMRSLWYSTVFGRDAELRCDALVGVAFRNQLQHFALPRGQGMACIVAGFRPSGRVKCRVRTLQQRRDVAAACKHRCHCQQELTAGRLLGHKGICIGFQRCVQIAQVDLLRDKDKLDARQQLTHLHGRFQSVQPGHTNVQRDDIRPKSNGFGNHLPAVAGDANHVVPWPQQRSNALCQQRVVIRNQNA